MIVKIKEISLFLILTSLTLTTLTGCGQKKSAPVTYKGDRVYYKSNSYNQEKYSQNTVAPDSILVKKGDNLYNIASKYNLSTRQIIETNNLKPPYLLVPNQKLLLPKPRFYTVKSGDNLYDISRKFNISLNSLIKTNDLSKPYVINQGEKLKIPSSIASGKNIAQTTQPSRYSDSKIASKSSMKFSWPIEGRVISKFGPKAGGIYNDGINISADKGAEVKAIDDGIVAYVGNELRGYGNLVIVKHDKGWISAYAHADEVLVKRGQKVAKETVIAKVGSSGNVDSSQLYFGLRKGRKAVDPQKYLN